MSEAGGAVRRGWRALRHRNYRIFFAGQFVSMSGTWMQQVAQGWLVLELTDDPFMLGLLAAAQFGPVVVVGLVGGIVADHLPKRTVLATTMTVQCALSLALFGLTAADLVQIWQVLMIAALQGTTAAIELPSRQSFVAELVGRDNLINAAGLTSMTINVGRIAGPATAGIVIGFAGIAVAFLLNAFTFIPAILGMLAIRERELMRPPAPTRPASFREFRRSLTDGPRFVLGQPLVRTVFVVLAIAATFGLTYLVLVPALARDVLHLDARGYGFLMAASGAGSMASAVIVVFARRIDPRAMAAAAALLGLAVLVLAVSRSYLLSLVAITVAGGGAIGMVTAGNTFVQLAVPDALRGRVMSVWTTVFGASTPLGGLLLGAIAGRADVAIALGVGGIVATAAGLVSLAWCHRLLTGRPA